MLMFVVLMAFVAISRIECGLFSETPMESLKKLNDYLEKEAHLNVAENLDNSKVFEATQFYLKNGPMFGKASSTFLENFIKLQTLEEKNICLPESHSILNALVCNGKTLDDTKGVASRVITSYFYRQAQFCYAGFHAQWTERSKKLDSGDLERVTEFATLFDQERFHSKDPWVREYEGPAGLGALLREGNPLKKEVVDKILAKMGVDMNQMTGFCRRIISSPAGTHVLAALDNVDPRHTWMYYRQTDDFHWTMVKHLLCRQLVMNGVMDIFNDYQRLLRDAGKRGPVGGGIGGSLTGGVDPSSFGAGGMAGFTLGTLL